MIWYMGSLLVALMLAVGQALFKASAISWAEKDKAGFSVLNIISTTFVASLVLYGLATILWIIVLRNLPLSKAYPIMLVGSACIPLIGYFFFNEALTIRYMVGFGIVLAGLYITVS